MKYIVKCNECGSTDLKTIEIVFGQGTHGERYEDGFKCTICGNEMTLDEIDFVRDKNKQTRKIVKIKGKISKISRVDNKI